VLNNILDAIYKIRYSPRDEKKKNEIWQVLCKDFLQQYVKESDSVLDIAAGHCEFINHITCRRKYAVDLNKRVIQHANKNVRVYVCNASKLPNELSNIDVVFMGCLLEHLPSKDDIIKVFLEVKRVLKKGGMLLILNPNIRFSTSDFWDYFDHLTPVSDRSIVEVLTSLEYLIKICLPRFVPNTIADRLPKIPLLVKLYLKMPFLFPIFGKQMFIVAQKKG